MHHSIYVAGAMRREPPAIICCCAVNRSGFAGTIRISSVAFAARREKAQATSFSRHGCARVLPMPFTMRRPDRDLVGWAGGEPGPHHDRAQQQIKGRRDADRRVSYRPHLLRDAVATPTSPSPTSKGGKGGGRSHVGVPPRHLPQRTNAAAQLQNALPGTRSERTTPMVRKAVRLCSGRYPRRPVPVQRDSRRPVIMPAGRLPGAARERR
jgi:hypothetical protein